MQKPQMNAETADDAETADTEEASDDDQKAADEVAALIDKIYVQERLIQQMRTAKLPKKHG